MKIECALESRVSSMESGDRIRRTPFFSMECNSHMNITRLYFLLHNEFTEGRRNSTTAIETRSKSNTNIVLSFWWNPFFYGGVIGKERPKVLSDSIFSWVFWVLDAAFYDKYFPPYVVFPRVHFIICSKEVELQLSCEFFFRIFLRVPNFILQFKPAPIHLLQQLFKFYGFSAENHFNHIPRVFFFAEAFFKIRLVDLFPRLCSSLHFAMFRSCTSWKIMHNRQ